MSKKRCQKSWRINAMKIFSRIERQHLGKGGIHSGMSGKLECKRKRVFQLAKRIREMFSYSTCNELNFYAEVKAMAVLCW